VCRPFDAPFMDPTLHTIYIIYIYIYIHTQVRPLLKRKEIKEAFFPLAHASSKTGERPRDVLEKQNGIFRVPTRGLMDTRNDGGGG